MESKILQKVEYIGEKVSQKWSLVSTTDLLDVVGIF